MTDTRIKIIFYWLLIGVCFILHNSLDALEVTFGKAVEIIQNEGVIPYETHVFSILVQISPFILVLLSLNFTSKKLSLFSLIWSILFLILNTAHLLEVLVIESPFNLTQTVLLTLILLINIMLTISLLKSLKQTSNKAVNK